MLVLQYIVRERDVLYRSFPASGVSLQALPLNTIADGRDFTPASSSLVLLDGLGGGIRIFGAPQGQDRRVRSSRKVETANTIRPERIHAPLDGEVIKLHEGRPRRHPQQLLDGDAMGVSSQSPEPLSLMSHTSVLVLQRGIHVAAL